MKQIFLSLITIFALVSCSSDNDNDSNDNSQEYVVTQPPFGVWESGNYFVSWDVSEGLSFYSAYLADDFIDSGVFEFHESNMSVDCDNPYFNRHTTFSIEEYDGDNITISFKYQPVNGDIKQKRMSFKKSANGRIDKWELNKRTWSEQWFCNGMEAFCITEITNYNEGLRTTDFSPAKDYPLSLFYVYRGNTMYYQLFNQKTDAPAIDGWNTDADTGKVLIHNIATR